jgi:hypothetical protein
MSAAITDCQTNEGFQKAVGEFFTRFFETKAERGKDVWKLKVGRTSA